MKMNLPDGQLPHTRVQELIIKTHKTPVCLVTAGQQNERKLQLKGWDSHCRTLVFIHCSLVRRGDVLHCLPVSVLLF